MSNSKKYKCLKRVKQKNVMKFFIQCLIFIFLIKFILYNYNFFFFELNSYNYNYIFEIKEKINEKEINQLIF